MDTETPTIDPELLRAFRNAVRRKIEQDIAREEEDAERRRAEVVPLVREAVAAARADGLCGAVWLIGSYAWGAPNERSDVDLLAEDCPDRIELAVRVGDAVGLDVHVLRPEQAEPTLLERARDEGVPL